MLNSDYKDMLSALSGEKVKFILVGAYALAVHGFPRATMDIDFWVFASPENSAALLRALRVFGAPLEGIHKEDFEQEGLVFQIGVAPRRIDIITAIDGLAFEDAWSRALITEIDGIPVRVLSKKDMIINKRATGRTKDIADAEMLEQSGEGD